MSLTLYGIDGCYNTRKVQIAAKYAGKTVELKAPEAAVHPLGCTCCPALVDDSVNTRVNLFGAAAIAKYIAKGSSLLPACEYGAALVDSWCEFAANVAMFTYKEYSKGFGTCMGSDYGVNIVVNNLFYTVSLLNLIL